MRLPALSWLRSLGNDPAFFAWVGLALLVAALLTSFFSDRATSDHELRESIACTLVAIYLRVSRLRTVTP